jgi:polyisoprenoid-binding protein YceI
MPLAALVLCACVATCTPGFAPAAFATESGEPWPMTLGAGSTLWIEGTSTLHPWSSRTDSLSLVFRGASGTAKPADTHGLEAQVRGQGVSGVAVDVPVHSLRSKESKLDKNLWHALKNEEFANVHFELASYTLGAPHGDTLNVLAKGTLTISGQARPVELPALAYPSPAGLWLVGSHTLLMTDYGIKPPTMMMGTIRVGDKIQVLYRLLLVPGPAGMPETAAVGDEKGAHK